MSRDSVAKVILLLAASPLSNEDLEAFSEWLAETNPLDFAQAISQVRRQAGSVARSVQPRARFAEQTEKLVSSIENDLAARIQGLMRSTNLTSTEIAQEIRHRLMDRHPKASLPVMGKEGLSRWIVKLARAVTASEILQVTAQMANDFSKKKPSDWPLRDD